MPVPPPARSALAWLTPLMLVAACALQAASVSVDVGLLEVPGWRASGLRLSMRPDADGVVLQLDAAGIGRSDGETPLSARAHCVAGVAEPSLLRCREFAISVPGAGGEDLQIAGSGTVQLAPDGFDLDFGELDAGAGKGRLVVRRHDERLVVDLALEAVDAPLLAALAKFAGPPDMPLANAGEMDIRLRFEHDGRRLLSLDAGMVARDVGFSDSSGLNAGEAVQADVRVTLATDGGERRVRADLRLDGGQVYLHPQFLDFGATPLTLTASGTADADGTFDLSEVRFAHAGVIKAHGDAQLSTDLVPLALRLDVERTPLAPVVAAWLRPWLPAELVEGVEAAGDFAAGLRWKGEEDVEARLDLYEAAIGDPQGRFALYGLDGRLQWHSSERRAVALRLGGADLYRLGFGATRLIGEVQGRRFTLLAPLRVPLFGGALRVDALHAGGIAAPDFELSMSGELEPLDLRTLSAALDWPAFGGTLSGTLPDLRYADGVLVLGSALRTQVFDGEVLVEGLRIEEPLGVVPVLRADVRATGVSLSALTEVFSFGAVSGRLEGEVLGLVLRNWQPRVFDARFATPADDRSEHRISQRAVKNLASLGGAAGALSAGFLGIFSEFSYDRLGLSCVLRNGLCRMGGVADAQDGYYIVIGGGLPRIDVVGFNRDVDWSVLVDRLIQATRTDGPVVR